MTKFEKLCNSLNKAIASEETRVEVLGYQDPSMGVRIDGPCTEERWMRRQYREFRCYISPQAIEVIAR